MDTIESTTPVGAEGATSSQDTVAQNGTQPVETPSSVSDGTGTDAGTASETLLAGKYKSPQELEKAYKELEGKLGTLGQKAGVADLLQERYGVSPEQLKAIVEQQEQAKLEQQMREDPSGFALREVQQMKAEMAFEQEQKKLDGFISANPEYAPFRDKILDLGLNLYNGEIREDKSYEDIANEFFGSARAQGQQDAYKKIDSKQMAQMTPTASVPKRTITHDDMRGMSVAELEAILPKRDNY